MNFHDNMYPFYLQAMLNESRLSGLSCDVVLVVDNNEMNAHKSVLAAASPYFSAMFHSVAKFKESLQDKVTLHDVDSKSVATILDFLYTSKIKITESNVYDLMETSNLFQIYSLKVWISNFLQSLLTTENCLGLYLKASCYNYYDLTETTFNYILENFSQVVRENEFLEISANTLKKFLSSKFLNVSDEDVLVKCILRWIKADVDNRMGFAIELLAKVELQNLPLELLFNLKDDPIFQEYVPNKVEEYLNDQIAMWYANYGDSPEPLLNWRNVRYGSYQGIILAIGGESRNASLRNVECFTLGCEAWKCMIPQYVHSTKGPQNMSVIPAMKHARHNAAMAYDFFNVYILGGRDDYRYLNDCETFNVNTRKWTFMKSLPKRLEGASAVIFEGRLIITGGRNEFGPTNEAWEWDNGIKMWRRFPSLIYARSFHSTVSLGGYIYALGGFESDDEEASRLGERYDPNVNKWFEIRSMQKARAKFGCAVICNSIYVLGGIDSGCGLMSVEKYTMETNEWSFMTPMLVPRHSFAVAVWEKKIYCIGGSDTIHVLHSVDKFNPLTNRWHFLLSMQMCRCGLASATLIVPYITCRL